MHPHYKFTSTSDLTPGFLAQLTRRGTCLLVICLNSQEVEARSASPPPGLQRTPLLVFQRALLPAPNAASRSFFSVLRNPYKKVTLSLALRAAITTHPLKPRQSQKPYIRRINSDKISWFSGLHCALSLGLLRLWLVWLRWKVVISVEKTAWAVPVHLSGGLL